MLLVFILASATKEGQVMRLAAIVYLKIVLTNELLDSAAVGNGDETYGLLMLQDKTIGSARIVGKRPEWARIDWFLYQEAIGDGCTQLA